jgi:hypothetical protein
MPPLVRREPLPRNVRRVSFTVSLDPKVITDLGRINPNRSKAIEDLVADYYARQAAAAKLIAAP